MATGGGPQGFDHLSAIACGAQLQPFHVLQRTDRFFARIQNARTVGVKVHDFHIVEFGWFEFVIDLVGHIGSGHSGLVSQREIHHGHDGKTSLGIGQGRHADIGDALDHSVVILLGGRQGITRKILYFNFAVGAFFHFLGPFVRQFGLDVGGREKVAVGQCDCIVRDG